MVDLSIKDLRAKGLGYKAIADIVGSNKDLVKKYCKRHGIAGFVAQAKGSPVSDHECKQCGKVFKPIGNDRITFCSRECSSRYYSNNKAIHMCIACGVKVSRKGNKCANCYNTQRRKVKEAKPLLILDCTYCGLTFQSIKSKKYCSNGCQTKYSRMIKDIKRRTKLSSNGSVDYSITLPKLYIRYKGICAICLKGVDMNRHHNDNLYGSIDHIVSVSKGGKHQWNNVQLAHRLCNSNKGE